MTQRQEQRVAHLRTRDEIQVEYQRYLAAQRESGGLAGATAGRMLSWLLGRDWSFVSDDPAPPTTVARVMAERNMVSAYCRRWNCDDFDRAQYIAVLDWAIGLRDDIPYR